MNRSDAKIAGAVILADASAHWLVAGLRQLDRLALALDEFSVAAKSPGPIPVCILWTFPPPDMAQRFPRHSRLTHLSFTDDLDRFVAEVAADAAILVLDTHLVVERDSLASLLDTTSPNQSGPWRIVGGMELSSVAKEKTVPPSEQANESTKWHYLQGMAGIAAAEKWLLSSTAKSQDGVISRYVNRPLSRALSRRLVRTGLRPNQLTIILMGIPMAGACFLLRGDYLGFALGAVLFQLHSALDGCDGEIARVKYQDSIAGRKLDGLCDRFTTLLYAVSLGVGLARQPGIAEAWRWIYPLEGVLAALLIGVSETWLSRESLDEVAAEKARESHSSQDFLEGHRATFNAGDQLKIWMIKNSGLLFLGEGLTSLFGQLTKRDVFNFGFMLLALGGRPGWILHILAICACAIMAVAVKDLMRLAFDPGRLGSG